MKTLLAIGMLLLGSQLALAHPVIDLLHSVQEQNFAGDGTWRGMQGASDTWSANLNVSEWETGLENHVGLKLTWDLSVRHDDTVIPMTTTLHLAVDNDFFMKIYDQTGLVQIGLGYCDQQNCHISTATAEGTMEESWTVKEGSKEITVLGSHSFGGQNTVAAVYRGTYKEVK